MVRYAQERNWRNDPPATSVRITSLPPAMENCLLMIADRLEISNSPLRNLAVG
jgi:hypothetical protein